MAAAGCAVRSGRRAWALPLVLALAPAARGAGTAPLLLDPLFADHMVFQEGAPLGAWGDAEPGATVRVALGTVHAQAVADAQGHWFVRGPRLQAGGPWTLVAEDPRGSVATVSDAWVGDVWLCSGQSNMGLPVSASQDGQRAADAASDPLLRLLTVEHRASPAPASDVPVRRGWQAADPQVVRDFSAACYFFGRSLRARHPERAVGLVHASWEGSRIEPWLDAASLRATGAASAPLDQLADYARDPALGLERFVGAWQAWWQQAAGDAGQPWSADPAQAGEGWQQVPLPLRDWKTWGVPALARYDGLVWYRNTFELDADQARGPARLDLGGIDEVDVAWVNGRPVGSSFGWGTARSYALPEGALHGGTNTVAVAVLSTWDAGGMLGPAQSIVLHPASGPVVPPAAGWLYRAAPKVGTAVPTAPWLPLTGVSTLFNGMIAPLGRFPVAGVAWYQGESNTGEPQQYRAQLAALMQGWRRAFDRPLRFLVVQLPGFGPLPGPVARPSGWAALREAQRTAVAADPLSALVPTLDLGDWDALHPAAKQPVGERLALAAQRLEDGGTRAAGVLPLRAVRAGRGRVRVDFAGLDGGLEVHGARSPTGFQACAGAQACRYVDARLAGGSVWLETGDASGPMTIRYAWEDTPTPSLWERSGLPLIPFELPVQRD